ncbi:uncharacterized protein LOC144142579 [Haemaphysalis longicornis]
MECSGGAFRRKMSRQVKCRNEASGCNILAATSNNAGRFGQVKCRNEASGCNILAATSNNAGRFGQVKCWNEASGCNILAAASNNARHFGQVCDHLTSTNCPHPSGPSTR